MFLDDKKNLNPLVLLPGVIRYFENTEGKGGGVYLFHANAVKLSAAEIFEIGADTYFWFDPNKLEMHPTETQSQYKRLNLTSLEIIKTRISSIF